MARPLRVGIPGGFYHVTSRGTERREIVRDDSDRRKWVELLGEVASRRRWRVFAWALMTNHFHLFLETPDADLSAGMHDLNSGYVSTFNRRHGRCGPLLQGRFKAILVERSAHDWELSRYVHLNPVRAGLAATPGEYAWSSCGCYLGRREPPEWLAWEDILLEHGRMLRAARRAYARYLAEGVERPSPSPLARVVASTFLGSESFVARMRARLEGSLPDREVPAAREFRARLDAPAIEEAVCRVFRVGVEAIRARGIHGNDARAVVGYLCRKLAPCSMVAVGRRLGGITGQAAGKLARAVAGRLPADKGLRGAVEACERALREKFRVTT
ncbi:MAG: addiction module toxin RelE [Planctomycetes bacterium]|nr:addiction module toxin RelE [Planctomycetota bacterium]